MPQSHRATEIRREGETRRRGDKETRRFSPFPLFPLSPCLLVLSLCLCVSVANSSSEAQPAPAQSDPAIKDPAARVTKALAGASYLVAEILEIEDPAARAAVLRKFLETGNTSEQIQTAREAVITRRAQSAESALGQNNIERAMENFRRAVAGTPERVTDRFFEETVIRIPFALSARGYRNEAVEMARELERRFAKEPSRLASLGEVYLQTQIAFHYLAQNKLKQAQQAVAAALLVEPRYSWARIAAAEVDLANGRYFEAERNLIAARSYANFPTLYFTLGKLYLAVEDFDGALEQFSKAFDYSPQGRFTARLGGVFDAQADNLKDLLSREHQAAIFLAEPPTKGETFKIAEALVRFNSSLRAIRAAMNSSSTGETGDGVKGAAENAAEARRGHVEEMERAAMEFIEAEGSRRSFRMLSVAERLAQAGVSTGLAVELAEQALGLAQTATEAEGSLREYPNYDRNGRLAIFRGRSLSAKGWALFKAGKNREAAAALTESTQVYGSLPEGRRALWRLATVKETQGELKEALDLYIAGYEAPGSGSELDRAVIESLYRKINGSLDGLDKRLRTNRIQ